ncbi:MAG: 2-amino-4-hydroxy-6-hydroxymethyldihydropteridine diphosphokinase [Candidatus Hydrogenedentes bacterium]|nr:2-amino-4-hydroxy-6-hydroxymethyldihydropteridine diphosphokinase [Candidatus Hydrogenedentota bacterium]
MTDAPGWPDAIIALGSNIAPRDNLAAALALLAERLELAGLSNVYRSPALGRPEQPDFLNAACRVRPRPPATRLEPRRLKADVLRPIEARLGRRRTPDTYAARPIDLDIALCGPLVIDEPGLRIPDPDIRTRPFLAVPLYELVPDAVLPDTGEELSAIVQALPQKDLTIEPDFSKQLKARYQL